MSKILLLSLLVCLSISIKIEDILRDDVIVLPEPKKEGGKPLYQVINARKSSRNYIDDEKYDLSIEQISQLLWMAYGPNRDNGYKTVPSAHAAFPFDIYVFLRSAVYKYNPTKHQLELVIKRDFRAITGADEYVANANLNLAFIGSYAKEEKYPDQMAKIHAMEWDQGFMGENVIIYAISEGLKVIPRANINYRAILQAIGLDYKLYYIPLCMSIGK
ncbi:MAG: nitroreductase family protein [archaeon]|nr:nitroreductase family protein [archaeon]